MHTISYTLKLLSDATPGTGLGGESVNEYVTRRRDGAPILAASHLKGLVRQELFDRLDDLGWPSGRKESFLRRCLGAPGIEDDAGVEGAARFSDAEPDKHVPGQQPTRFITRTAIDGKTGTVKNTSLRTVEAVNAGTEFRGRVFMACSADDPAAKAIRLALLCLTAVGGLRTRGSGRCVATIQDCPDTPGGLLKELAALAETPALEKIAPETVARDRAEAHDFNQTPVFFLLRFKAESPVCCPELPVRHNVISSGFAIPASSLQGALLHHLNATDPEAADALFASPSFRAWPLLPCGDEKLAATRVSLTHRASKLVGDDAVEPDPSWFQDEAIKPYDWRTVSGGAPLKASDGVLLSGGENVKLWKSAAMPRWISAHGVHNDRETEDGRNLFSVESLAVKHFSGRLSLPAFAAEIFGAERNIQLSLGKSRSVRGRGELSFERVDSLFAAPQSMANGKCILVVQSPLRLPDAWTNAEGSFNQEFQKLAEKWASENELGGVDAVWGVHGIRFGWSRHGGTGGRIRARRVALPGAVLRLKGNPDPAKLAAALLRGLGDGREEGFGALSPHPGIAAGLYKGADPDSEIRKLGSGRRKEGVELALACFNQAKKNLPSASQIRALMAKYNLGGERAAVEYLDRQLQERSNRIWSQWRPIVDNVKKLLQLSDKRAVLAGLEMLANLALSVKR
ncbi:MAG: RAMP superfamily CRISPR-associated protein [Planctomycetota bacterium]|jgi:hypothetical protein|nr:RAMP superfamily CRISPR-associated protein [Planctomycetota bacterium]